jgi:hypothetical protein
VIVRLIGALVEFAAIATVPLDGLTVISPELLVAVHAVVSAYAVEVSVNVAPCDVPLVSDTGLAVIVYAGAVTVSVVVPLELTYDDPVVGV